MKITRKKLKKLIETFIVDPKGRAIDYQKIIDLEKEYAETHSPELLKKIDALKKTYTSLPFNQKYAKDEPYEKASYDSAVELETGMMRDFGQTKGLNPEDSEYLASLMDKYGEKRGKGEYFYDTPGRVPKEGIDGGYPSAETRKERFIADRDARKERERLTKVYEKVDALISPAVDNWFDNNTESLIFDNYAYDLLPVSEVAHEIADEIASSKGYADFYDLLEQDSEYSTFEDDSNFINKITEKIIEYFDNEMLGDGYVIDGASGYSYLSSGGRQFEVSSGNQHYDSPHIGYYSK